MEKSAVTPPNETRNWLDLPKAVNIDIFLRLGVIHVMYTAQFVCSSWLKLAKEPQLFRCVDLRRSLGKSGDFGMAVEVIQRSCGQLVEFSVTNFGSEGLLSLPMNAPALKCLRLANCYRLEADEVTSVLRRLPSLEEIEFCHCSFDMEKVIEVAGSSCLELKSFRLIHVGEKGTYTDNDEAFAIAASMPHLRCLQLFGNEMNNTGLRAILDKCPHLEDLDLRQCFNVKFHGKWKSQRKQIEKLESQLKRIGQVKFPYGATDDCEFDTELYYYYNSDDDEYYGYGYGYGYYDSDED